MFASAPAGMPGVQELLSAMFTGLRSRGLTPLAAAQSMARLMSEAPARLFGLCRKGRLNPGMHADLVIFDPAAQWEPGRDPLYSTCRWSPNSGQHLLGRVQATYLRGKVIYEMGSFRGDPRGELVTPWRC